MLVPIRQPTHRVRGLPRGLTSFVGRATETAALREAVERGHALITVWGTGGIGKTRLVAHALS